MVYHINILRTKSTKGGEDVSLKRIRKNAKLTQEQLAKLTGFSLRYISLLENNRRNPSDKAKRRLAKALNVDIVTIFLAFNSTKSSKKLRKEAKSNE